MASRLAALAFIAAIFGMAALGNLLATAGVLVGAILGAIMFWPTSGPVSTKASE